MPGRTPKPLVAGNWKMNGSAASRSLLAEIAAGYGPDLQAKTDLLVCPPAVLVPMAVATTAATTIAVGGQDCHAKVSGAHTGDIAAAMLAEAGATFVIVGHSERRTDHAETDAVVKAKAEATLAGGLTAIVCVGETKDEREAGRALAVVEAQVRGSLPAGASPANTVIAYEPVWAIGTGLVPTVADVEAMHADIRRVLGDLVGQDAAGMRILYGGSVKPGNARELLGVANVDGALVGGASLVAADFLGIAAAYS
ncbi:triose-phosphate isomerase [Enterovirga rhinocerotis]|uniref:Triosephosphate isomerase n=1 Tax=Enterovirga rhinocerotis TaxID=1339210 RepID=A0A4R7C766_9HYPH|nr:triose-phosphate isomerase [Enterovirga rhinocerotis]TDR93993.1 triosephosphate isomerase [Enterovirga rhinocerotis]